jgi:hypothetical protein
VLYSNTFTTDALPVKSTSGDDGTWVFRTGGQTQLVVDPNFKPINGLQEIIVYPNPPSLGIPNDDDLRYYGFYDYAHLPGEESQTAKDDGGKDYWFAAWLRSCPFPIPVLPAMAAARYNATWWHNSCDKKHIYAGGNEFIEHHPISAITYDDVDRRPKEKITLVSGSLNTQNLIGGIVDWMVNFDSTELVITNSDGLTLHPLSYI